MKQPDVRAFLFDVQQACRLLREFTAGMSLKDYLEDPKTRSAVERQLEIIGEAIGQMIRVFPEMEEEIPDASRIISFRNRLIHGYATVSHPVVWGILESDVPELYARVDKLLASSGG